MASGWWVVPTLNPDTRRVVRPTNLGEQPQLRRVVDRRVDVAAQAVVAEEVRAAALRGRGRRRAADNNDRQTHAHIGSRRQPSNHCTALCTAQARERHMTEYWPAVRNIVAARDDDDDIDDI